MKTIEATPEDMGDLGSAVWGVCAGWKSTAKTIREVPDGVAQEFSGAMQAFFAGKSDANKMLEDMQTSWDSLKK